jgi:hypothetical protein
VNSNNYDFSRAERQTLVWDCAAASEAAAIALARCDERLLRANLVLAEGCRFYFPTSIETLRGTPCLPVPYCGV